MSAPVRQGDTVTIGRTGKVHWVVNVILPHSVKEGGPLANLYSGMTGIHRYNVPLKKLHLHTKGTK